MWNVQYITVYMIFEVVLTKKKGSSGKRQVVVAGEAIGFVSMYIFARI